MLWCIVWIKLNGVEWTWSSFVTIMIMQICAASTNEEVRIICKDTSDMLVDCGFTKPPFFIGLVGTPALVKAISLHHIILKCKAELNQLKDGLGTLGVADAMKLHPSLFEPLSIASEQTELTPGTGLETNVEKDNN